MAIEQTLSIIKPDGVEKNIMGKIISRFETNNLKVIAVRMIHMSKRQAEGFYAVHKERPFFGSLTDYMSSGPCLVMVLEGEGAIAKNRELMGATNPDDADEGTIRKDFATSLEANTVHGSDAPDTAAFEISYFFQGMEVLSR